MDTNLFQELRNKREQVKLFAQTALDKKWITPEEYKDIVEKIENDILTIGVIGQMKAGKSTFLNAFLFGEEILPSATTPMTAALSVITYGEEKSIEVEFYTANEWQEMKLNANRDLESVSGDKITESKIKAAKELVEKAERIGANIDSLLGTTQKDSLDNLIEYVGADGKYVALTKSVTIYYPEEWLKGVRVVDTPGFNDPVVSREERTQEFLKQADAVLLLLYAGRAFDATDREIVFDKVRKVGIGKILIGINKYDIQYSQGETVEQITNNVKEEIKKACREENDEMIKEMLQGIEPIPFSANMALMAKMPIDNIMSKEVAKFYWDKACDDFEISSQQQMLEKSLVKDLEKAFKDVIEKSKEGILLRKPIHQIISKGAEKLQETEKHIAEAKIEKQNLSETDENWEEKIKDIERAEKRINYSIEDTTSALYENIKDILRKTTHKLEDDKDNAYKRMQKEIEDANRFTGQEKTLRRLKDIKSDMTKNLIRDAQRCEEEIIRNIKGETKKLITEIEGYLRRYFKEDYEDILIRYKQTINRMEYMDEEENDEEENDFVNEQGKGSILRDILNIVIGGPLGPLLSPLDLIDNALGEWKKEYHSLIEDVVKNGEIVERLVEELQKRTDYYLSYVDAESAKCILSDLIKMREEYRGKASERLARISELEQIIHNKEEEKSVISHEISEMKSESKKII